MRGEQMIACEQIKANTEFFGPQGALKIL